MTSALDVLPVTIIVPTYNRAQRLREARASSSGVVQARVVRLRVQPKEERQAS